MSALVQPFNFSFQEEHFRINLAILFYLWEFLLPSYWSLHWTTFSSLHSLDPPLLFLNFSDFLFLCPCPQETQKQLYMWQNKYNCNQIKIAILSLLLWLKLVMMNNNLIHYFSKKINYFRVTFQVFSQHRIYLTL